MSFICFYRFLESLPLWPALVWSLTTTALQGCLTISSSTCPPGMLDTFPVFLHPTFFLRTVLMGAVWGVALSSLFWWQSVQVASPLKMIYVALSSRLLFLTPFLLENATAAMFCILKDGIYRKVVARQHVWDYRKQMLSDFRMKLY